MVLQTIYIARHGFRQHFDFAWSNASGPTGTHRDPPLTALGLEQAKELAHYLSGLQEDKVDLIYSSPYYRCLQTSTPVAEQLNKPILVEFGISEFYQTVIPGTGLHPRPPLAAKLVEHFPHVSIDTHDPLLFAPQTGETISGIHARAKQFLELLIEHVNSAHPDVKSVLLVSHAATVIALGRALCNDKEKDVRAGTCSLSKYVNEESQQGQLGRWRCELNGSTAHLRGGEQRHWDFTMSEEMEEAGYPDLVDANVSPSREAEQKSRL